MKKDVKLEIERKYLGPSTEFPFNLTAYPHHIIEQAYISLNPTIRIRHCDTHYILTMKGSGEISREEYEMNISKQQYENLLNKLETPFVRKKRYLVPLSLSEYTAEIDIFKDSLEGLVLIEVEFPTLEEANQFQAPKWFGKDVTADKRYKNTSLSLYGIPAE